MRPERTCVLACLPPLGPSALLARCPWATWPISLLQSCQPSKGWWVHTVCRELDFYTTNLHTGLFTLDHTLVCMCLKISTPGVGRKGTGCASIPGTSDSGTHTSLPVLHKGAYSSIKGFCSYLGQTEECLECFPAYKDTEDLYKHVSFLTSTFWD